MRRNWVPAVVAAAVVVSCAKNPDAIAPMTMPLNAYSGLTCEQLGLELQKSQIELTRVEAEQRSAVQGDAVGVFLIGVPMSSLTGGDKEGIVAQKKGEVIAIQGAQRQGGCMVAPSAMPAAMPPPRQPPKSPS